MTAVAEGVGRTRQALRDAAVDARSAWSPTATVALGVLALAAVLPSTGLGFLTYERLVPGVYLALAAVGLGISVGLAGIPSLAQGAFMAIGAFGAALLRARAGWPLEAAVVVAVLVAVATGLVTGLAVVRLRGVFVAVSTWILTWTVVLALTSFSDLSGGAAGIVMPQGSLFGVTLTPGAHYALGLALVALCVLGFVAVARGPAGNALAAAREQPDAVLGLGAPLVRLRLGAFAASAGVAGLAGALGADFARVADAGSYGPFLSFKLLAAVVLGGATVAVGGAAGIVALGLLVRVSHLGGLGTVEVARVQAMLTAVCVLFLLGLGTRGAVPWLLDRWDEARNERDAEGRADAAERDAPGEIATTRRAPEAVLPAPRPARLVARGLTRRFGNLAAVDGLDLELSSGRVEAVIGPNGSGKTTALRLVTGVLTADAGEVALDGERLDGLPVRERALRGIVGTAQATIVFAELTAAENVAVGVGLRRRYGGAMRSVLSTPLHRAENAQAAAAVEAALEAVGLGGRGHVRAGELDSAEQRLLMIAAALATSPRVLCLDEPAAGAATEEVERLAGVIERLRRRGYALLLVEHNLRLVRAVADRVTVLEAGRAIASGTVEEAADDPAVRAAYLGRQRL